MASTVPNGGEVADTVPSGGVIIGIEVTIAGTAPGGGEVANDTIGVSPLATAMDGGIIPRCGGGRPWSWEGPLSPLERW